MVGAVNMKNYIVNNSLNLIKKNNPTLDEVKLAEIKYGLVSIYLLISKLIIICIFAYLLGIIKEMIIFMSIYNIIRMPSFGIHASKSWICLIVSLTLSLGCTYLCLTLSLNIYIKCFIGIICLVEMYKNSPADTHKKPIVSPTRRMAYKTISVLLTIVFITLAIILNNNFLSNCFLIALVVQCFVISPFTYKIFNMPYNNYKTYQKYAK